LALDIDPQAIGGLIVLSGDGTLGEIMNGFYQHPKRQEMLAIPIGVVPAGSGAGVYQTIKSFSTPINPYKRHEERDIVEATLRICDWNPAPTKLLELDVTDEKKNNQKFLTIFISSFGGAPEFIQLTEKLRWTRLGSFRYLLVMMFLNLRKKRFIVVKFHMFYREVTNGKRLKTTFGPFMSLINGIILMSKCVIMTKKLVTSYLQKQKQKEWLRRWQNFPKMNLLRIVVIFG